MVPRPAAPSAFRLGDWIVEPARDCLSRDGDSIKLDPRDMQVMLCLTERAGDVVTQAEIETTVWTDVVVGPNSVYQSIAHLRRALGDDRAAPRYIETIPRKGYRLLLPVEPLAEGAPASPATVASPRRRPPRWATVAILLGVILIGLGYLLIPDTLRERIVPGRAEERSIAVLPLVSLDPANDTEYLADGITEELLNALSLLPELKVVARTSAFAFKGRNEDVRDIGRALDVRYVLEGSVRRSGNQIRVTAQLVGTDDGYRVWSQAYDRPFADLLVIQSDIAREVANSLRVVMTRSTGERLAQREQADVGAYELYLLGQHLWQQRTPEALSRAIPYLERSISLDPDFAPAYAALAQARLSAYYYAGIDIHDARRDMEPAIERALAIDPSLPEAYAIRGLLHTELLDFSAAESDLKRAIELNPNYANAHMWLGMTLNYQGRPREGLEQAQRAASLDPLFFQNPNWIASALVDLGRYAEAVPYHQRAAELSRGHINALWPVALGDMAQGRLADAARAYESMLERAPYRTDLGVDLGWLYLDLGRLPDAQRVFEAARDQPTADEWARIGPLWLDLAAGRPALITKRLDALPLSGTRDGWAWANVAYLRAFSGAPRPAIEDYQQAVAREGEGLLYLKSLYGVRWGRMHALALAAARRDTGDEAAVETLTSEALQQLRALQANGVAWNSIDYLLAAAHALRDERAASLKALDAAIAKGWRRTWQARRDPAFRALSDDPQFVAALVRADALVAQATNR